MRLTSFLIAMPLLAAEPVPLPVSADAWTPEPGAAVRMGVVSCPPGKCLSIGPWRAGRSARYRYAKRIVGAAGTVRSLDAAPQGAAFAAARMAWYRARGGST